MCGASDTHGHRHRERGGAAVGAEAGPRPWAIQQSSDRCGRPGPDGDASGIQGATGGVGTAPSGTATAERTAIRGVTRTAGGDPASSPEGDPAVSLKGDPDRARERGPERSPGAGKQGNRETGKQGRRSEDRKARTPPEAAAGVTRAPEQAPSPGTRPRRRARGRHPVRSHAPKRPRRRRSRTAGPSTTPPEPGAEPRDGVTASGDPAPGRRNAQRSVRPSRRRGPIGLPRQPSVTHQDRVAATSPLPDYPPEVFGLVCNTQRFPSGKRSRGVRVLYARVKKGLRARPRTRGPETG